MQLVEVLAIAIHPRNLNIQFAVNEARRIGLSTENFPFEFVLWSETHQNQNQAATMHTDIYDD